MKLSTFKCLTLKVAFCIRKSVLVVIICNILYFIPEHLKRVSYQIIFVSDLFNPNYSFDYTVSV